MLHRLRLALRSGTLEKAGENGGEVEADETYVGGKAKNMHKARKIRLQQIRNEIPDWKAATSCRYYGKTAVIGILDRGWCI
jgi:hypothetical protein